jgi:hypothetical protein
MTVLNVHGPVVSTGAIHFTDGAIVSVLRHGDVECTLARFRSSAVVSVLRLWERKLDKKNS